MMIIIMKKLNPTKEFISEKAWARVNILRKFKFDLDRKSLYIIFSSFIRPLLEYGSGVGIIVIYKKSKL